VEDVERKLKARIYPENAYFKADGFELFQAVPREELHQFLIGVYGDYVIPATVYEYERVLRDPALITSKPGARITTYVISSERLAAVWARLRDRLSSVDASSSMVQVTEDYASHFYDMYINKHEGKHLTGDRVRILLLTLPFVLRDLIEPEVMLYVIRHNILYKMLYHTIYYVTYHGIYHVT
jgi:hypothetical protein